MQGPHNSHIKLPTACVGDISTLMVSNAYLYHSKAVTWVRLAERVQHCRKRGQSCWKHRHISLRVL